MEKNFSVVVEQFDGKPIKASEGVDLTLKDVCVGALLENYTDEKDLPGEEKFKRSMLAEKIYKADGSVDISVEELSLVKKLVGKRYATLIVGQAFKLLEK